MGIPSDELQRSSGETPGALCPACASVSGGSGGLRDLGASVRNDTQDNQSKKSLYLQHSTEGWKGFNVRVFGHRYHAMARAIRVACVRFRPQLAQPPKVHAPIDSTCIGVISCNIGVPLRPEAYNIQAHAP